MSAFVWQYVSLPGTMSTQGTCPTPSGLLSTFLLTFRLRFTPKRTNGLMMCDPALTCHIGIVSNKKRMPYFFFQTFCMIMNNHRNKCAFLCTHYKIIWHMLVISGWILISCYLSFWLKTVIKSRPCLQTDIAQYQLTGGLTGVSYSIHIIWY